MSRLSMLAQKIRSLPDIESEAARITIARKVGQDSQLLASKLVVLFRQAPHIDILKKKRLVETVNESISFAVNQAKTLKRSLQVDKFGSEKKISECLENLTKNVQKVESYRDNIWGSVQSEIQNVETILSIATTLKLDSVTLLEGVISTFKKTTSSPPFSTEDVEKVAEARVRCNNVIANSGLTGNVKIILEGAINDNGDPKLLLEDDVQVFLKDHPELWGSLKLKMA